jgi:hypothetical protein
MTDQVLFYLAGLLCIFWGVFHLVPTRNVVNGFGEISQDNKQVITMEWLVEGVSLVFIGILVTAVTWADPANTISRILYWIVVLELNILSVVSLFTGFKINFLPYKLCPLIFTGSSILIILGLLL